jgi:two-component system, chemotaxis family, chemotaxis protein CheY
MAKKVLIVDDSASVRQQVRMALSPAGFETVDAVDGLDGLAKLAEDADIVLAICDVNMPRMNGLEMLEAARKAGTRPELPMLMLTTEGQPALIQRAKEAGAKGWIVKPFKPHLLLATVQKLAGGTA